ncbi:branched-chain amino acid ABC transporter permease [Tianweitania sediminis]|uniref:Branched-chain amino acid ABC transporter permease n=1 Tax=Tianweitania sediminis TaxID=1502156 RepID=A0A8J7R393_9HYPH|nr:branched-chain amino acid ABC transporter permease [Tianweitania sediminis]MBP0440113.1 branched-chain amino acid ABC transporter permease [Tianweitania sediminis]HEV7418045.1 branched-chain amino acid ABC transporter permease [Tianweitania sediminis]
MTAASPTMSAQAVPPSAVAEHKPARFALARKTIMTPILLSLLLVAIAVLTYLTGSRPFNQTVIDVFVRVTLVVGLYIFIGNSGVLSFGHIAFTCLGGYAAAWLTINPIMKASALPGLPQFILDLRLPYWQSAVIAAIFAGVAALILGKVLMRLSGIAASIATFAVLAMINTIYANWDSVTGGTSSVVGIPIIRTIWPYLIGAIIAIFLAWAHAISRSGLALRAARDEPTAAAASGVDIPRERLVAFVVSGAVMGLGGALTAHSVGVVTPDTFYLGLTFITLSMLVVGGMGSLSGAVIGVVLLSALIQILRWMEAGISIAETTIALPKGVQEIALGVIMIVILALRPSGLLGNREVTLFQRKRNR